MTASEKALRSEIERLKVILVEAAIPLEAIIMSGKLDWFTDLGQREIRNAVEKIRAALTPQEADNDER